MHSKIEVIYVTENDTLDLDKQEGKFIDKIAYKRVIRHPCDIYVKNPEDGSTRLLAKFRKSVIPEKACKKAWSALVKFSQQWNDNRGAAAGILNLKKLPDHVGKITKKGKFRVFYNTKKGAKTRANVGNEVRSNIIGFYDRPDRNLLKNGNTQQGPPCRQTAFTRDQVEKWENCLPLIKSADRQFAKLVPDRYAIQKARCKLTPDFQILDTAFSTVTVNYNYRTALHKDSGDLEEGFGNLVILEKNKCESGAFPFQGGYIGFPRYGVCIDVRQGDFLAMDVHEWHANTRIICGCPAGKSCRQDDHHGRLSLVLYLRKDMAKCSHDKKKTTS